ncbi:MAG: tetratricopeptide repeat protein [Armatimonadota bacterium]
MIAGRVTRDGEPVANVRVAAQSLDAVGIGWAEDVTADELVAAGLAAKQAGDLGGAAETLRQALEIDADHVQAHWVMAWVQVELEQKAEAVRHFRRVVELTGDEDLREQAEAAIQRLQAE